MHTQESEDASASISSIISEPEVKLSSIAPDRINSNVKGIPSVALIGIISSIPCIASANIFDQAPSHQLSC